MMGELQVTLWHQCGDPAFITEVLGATNIDELQEIEREVNDNVGDYFDSDAPTERTFSVTRESYDDWPRTHVHLTPTTSALARLSSERDALAAEVSRLTAVLEGRAAGDHTPNELLRSRVAGLEGALDDHQWIRYHACVTGDCPHETEAECAQPLREQLIETGEALAAALGKAAK